jgi:two-component system, OmpR family, response regulator
MPSGTSRGTTGIRIERMNPKVQSPGRRATARVLFVEDEPKLRECLADGLRLEEWDVVTAASGAQALQRVREERFDLVVLDWMLPDLDGMEVLQRVRAYAPRLPVVMITARYGYADRVLALQNGATDYLIKPFAFEDLVARCRALLTPGLLGTT